MRYCFNPPCGFSVVSTSDTPHIAADHPKVSIRHADFRWFQPLPAPWSPTLNVGKFQSAMRIFGGFNAARTSAPAA